MIIGNCPACHSRFEIEKEPELGHRVICPDCAIAYEVTWLYPFTLDFLEVHTPTHLDLIESLETSVEGGKNQIPKSHLVYD